jgi:autotransporter-associated beta strand protein
MNELQNETVELNDLEPKCEVKGGPTDVAKLGSARLIIQSTGTYTGTTTVNQGTSTSGPGAYKSVDSGSTWTL